VLSKRSVVRESTSYSEGEYDVLCGGVRRTQGGVRRTCKESTSYCWGSTSY
jgi:hypothetical protein